MAILVTGAAGFIGYATARALLQRGERVVGIDNLNDYYDVRLKQARIEALAADKSGDFAFEQVDFADQAALANFAARHDFDRIVHLGAQAGVRYSIDHPHAYARANMLGHLNMLELARTVQPDHMIYASSSSVYGGNCQLPFRVEDRTERPLSLYAASKKAAEHMSEAYANLYRLPLTGLRFFTVYGPWGRPDMAMWLFTQALFAGAPLRLFNGGAMRRDFTYIDDIVRGLVSCLDRSPVDDGQEKAGGSIGPHAVYNIGNHRSEELLRVVELLERETGRTAVIELAPIQPGDVPDTFADISAIQRDHGFEPSTSIDDGIPRFVAWFRDYHGID